MTSSTGQTPRSAPPAASSAAALEPLPVIDRYLDTRSDRADFLKRGQAYLADLLLWLRNNSGHCDAVPALLAFSDGHDALMRATFGFASDLWTRERGQPPPNVALTAVGGYGNRLLCPRSDVDVLLLMEKHEKDTEAFLKSILLLLTDLKLNLSSLTRSIADCEECVGQDLQSVTSMTSARMLDGHAPLFEGFQRRFRALVTGRSRRWFLRAINEEWQDRRRKYDATVYLLQPNLKEGQGGLRDVDTLRWILFGLTGDNDLGQLPAVAGFKDDALNDYRIATGRLLALRNLLHQVAGVAGEVLMFEYQPEIARRLGYQPDEMRSAEEFLMADYYSHARSIDRISSHAVRKLLPRGRSLVGGLVGKIQSRRIDKHFIVQDDIIFIDPKSLGYFEADPARILAMFHSAARWGLRLSDHTLDNIARLSGSIGDDFADHPENRRHFMGILAQKTHVASTLADMHESRILGRLIPDFERLRCMVRIDHYHHFTVDEHTIKTVEMAEAVREVVNDRDRDRRRHGGGPSILGDVARRLKRPDLLHLALLLHDIGKGYGRGHALRGGQIAQRVCERFKLPDEDTELVRFLVLSHLKLSHAAHRRDLSDPEVTRQLTEEIGDLERLRMLYVLTACDLMAVSPDAWNDWKAQLLAECYLRTAELMGDTHRSRDGTHVDLAEIRRRVREALPAQVTAVIGVAAPPAADLDRELDDFLHKVSEFYLKTIPPETVALHCLMRRELDKENLLAWRLHAAAGIPRPAPATDDRRYSQLTVIASDVPGLFCFICGALASKGINIWAAQIFSTRDGYAINQFLVTDLENRPLSPDLRLDRLRKDLIGVIKGSMDIEDLVERHRTRQPRRALPRQVHPTRVFFHNQSSKRYTILEIRAADRPGLLYRITRALTDCQLDIHRSIVSTEAYGIVDVFYVTDMEYNKIHTAADKERVRLALVAAVDGEAGANAADGEAGANAAEAGNGPAEESVAPNA
jgi:[protein-PII] uridylyltransferase